MTAVPELDDPQAAAVAALAGSQAGVIGREQLRRLGIKRGFVRTQLRSRRWRRVHPRTYATFTGPLPFEARAWAGVLYAGGDAVASHRTAAFLAGLVDEEPERIEVSVRHGHRVASRQRLRIRQRRHLAQISHPSKSPPQTRVEDTVLDLTEMAGSENKVVDVLLAATQRRLTTASRLALQARGRKRLRWRRLIAEVLEDARAGVQSPLERRYLRDVERAHGLPRGRRNAAEGQRGRRRYRDVRYGRKVVVELDGRAAHPEEWRERDDLRDNEAVVADEAIVLRYGWRSVTSLRCTTAAQVITVLRRTGWRGTPRRCGPGCTVTD